ncbi:winged helix-turn-helix domain-containing protein [Nocardiopsis sp. MG754419]|uniref:winged helix-turn-helix domain-containing protein n=1 Tax=Nocardiopsis sp. MG754419 TaxID=2259865 RepID=UPI001BA80B6F|nr:winged helix-turn-helix domain-containing protein [Nocardiopsis sp. MG754419]MBR8740201.1 winged helix family transcriptional regulator [Nocardiopsis sp. MG754419]
MLSAHTATPGTDGRATRTRPSLAALPTPEDRPANTGPPEGDHSLLGVLPLPESGRYMLVYGVVVDEPHARSRPVPEVTGGNLLLDRDARRVWAEGREVELTYQEYELLDCLTASPGRAVTRSELLERVWGVSRELHSRTIDVHIHRLRRKLGPAGEHIATVRKVGYIYHGPRSSPPEHPMSVPERGD